MFMSRTVVPRKSLRLVCWLVALVACLPQLTADDVLQLARLVYPEPIAVPRQPVADAPEPPQPTLLVSHVSAHLNLRATLLSANDPLHLDEATTRRVTTSRHAPGQIERWTAFDREFGIQDRSRSGLKSAVQSVKYGIDQTVFAAMQLKDTVENATNYQYAFDDSTLRSRQETRKRRVPTGAHLESDVNVALLQRGVYLGVRFVVPWAD